MPQIEVTFDIDANGIVNVSAKDKATGKEQQIRIQASGGLSDADIEKMVKDAEANASSDKEKRSLIEAKNKAEAMAHEAEKNLREHGSLVSDADKSQIEADVKAVRESLETADKNAIEAKAQALSQSTMKLGEAIYKAQQTSGDAAAGAQAQADASQAPNAGPDGEVVDAHFEEVKDDKNH